MPEPTSPAPRYGPPTRGITGRDVELAADALLRVGERPTIEKIREKIGRGSPNTINPLLDAWWKRLASRLDAGPAALHRLPESVAHVAEALWMQALYEGRRRAEQEINCQVRDTARTKEDLDLRSHVLSLREGELESRLKDRERTQASLEAQLQELTILLRKEQATREAQGRRIASLEDELLATSSAGRAVRAFPALVRQRRGRRASPPRPSDSRAEPFDSVAASLQQGLRPKRVSNGLHQRGVAPLGDTLLARRKSLAAPALRKPVKKRKAQKPPARGAQLRRATEPKTRNTKKAKKSLSRRRRR